jgi:glyoxylase-like metal-dependent hydrolase (beta-lactamase superfamily II)
LSPPADSRFEEVSEHVDWYTPDDRTDRPALGAVHGTDATLIVEAGASVPHLSGFLAGLSARGRPPVSAIALTHWHWDHSFGAAAIDVPVIAHRDTAAELVLQAGYDWSDEALEERVRDGREIAFCAEMIKLEIPDRSGLRVIVPTDTFEAERVVDLGGVSAVIAHVGGDHSADSCVVHVPGDDVLFLGDCLYQRLHAPEPLLTTSGVRGLLEALSGFPVAKAIEGHGDEVLDSAGYAARLNELRRAADLVGARGAAALDAAAGDEELRELVSFLLAGERLMRPDTSRSSTGSPRGR